MYTFKIVALRVQILLFKLISLAPYSILQKHVEHKKNICSCVKTGQTRTKEEHKKSISKPMERNMVELET